MKRVFYTLALSILATCTTWAQDLPKPSPYGEVMQRIGLTDVKIEYSRPGVKERTIFGGLEAYGEVWRTGANAATKISFSTNVMIAGEEVKAGTYSVLTVPGEGAWKLMLNKDLGVSEGSYDAEKNVIVVEMEAQKIDRVVETLTFTFANVKEDAAEWTFEWENTMWTLPIEVKVDEQAMANIKEKIAEIEGAYGVYNTSARYFLDHDQDLEQALAWSKKSVEIEQKFWNVYTLSLIQAKMGNHKEAIKTAKISMDLAQKAEYKPYIKMNKENIEKWSKK
ncbi:MAG: DUF2911 domain-containing protein [Vicingaceae bacterium]